MFQKISTSGASGFKFFTINGEHYLAVAESYDSNRSYSIDSFVYKWQKGRFEKYQNIPTHGARACDSIVIANETYLVYANYYHSVTKNNVKLRLYKWSGDHFLQHQAIPSPQGTFSVKFFRVHGHVFLAFTSSAIKSLKSAKSPLYKWNGSKFTLFQDISTRGAWDLCPFEANGEMFLAFANYYQDGVGFSVPSVVYKASGAQFTHYQDLETYGARGVDAFADEGNKYLVIANYHKNKPQNR